MAVVTLVGKIFNDHFIANFPENVPVGSRLENVNYLKDLGVIFDNHLIPGI